MLAFIAEERNAEGVYGGGDDRLRELAEEAPIIEFVNNILAQAIPRAWSQPTMRIRTQGPRSGDREKPSGKCGETLRS